MICFETENARFRLIDFSQLHRSMLRDWCRIYRGWFQNEKCWYINCNEDDITYVSHLLDVWGIKYTKLGGANVPK